MNSTHFVFAATLFGGLFIGICIYFDRERHKDPYFLKKLKLRRKKDKTVKASQNKAVIKDVENPEALILQEIEIAEKLMYSQSYEKAILHFANAIALCSNPGTLLLALKRTLPPQSYNLLVQVLVDQYGEHFSQYRKDIRIQISSQNQVCDQ